MRRFHLAAALLTGLVAPASAGVVVRIDNSAQRMHVYHMSPMPHSLFFHGGYAIHGTGAIRQLGRPASHGCVRLHPANARALYGLVGYYGGARILVRT